MFVIELKLSRHAKKLENIMHSEENNEKSQSNPELP